MGLLAQEQEDSFWRDGVLVISNAVNADELAAQRAEIASWVEESRAQDGGFGETPDGRPRFDLQSGHYAAPVARGVQSPEEISEVFAETMRNANTVDCCVEPFGPAIRFHHGKVNSNGSAPNLSDQPRPLCITTYYAEDAIELSPNHLPSRLTHELVRGEVSGRVRCTPCEMELPAVPKATSFFAQQEGADIG